MELEKDPSLMISSESTGSSHHQSGPICPLVPLVPVVTNLHQSDSLFICARAFSLFSSLHWPSNLKYPNRLPRWHSGKESTCQCRRCKRCRFDPWAGKIPWSRKWQPTPVFLPEKFSGQRSLAGYSP